MNTSHPTASHNQNRLLPGFCLRRRRVGGRRIRPLMLGSFCAFVCLFLLPGLALAHPQHAEYVSSDPAANAMLQKAPTTITIHFMENLNPQGSDITVYDVDGKQVSTGSAQVDRADLKSMMVNIQPNKSEIYTVNWHNVSAVEGHHDSGSFRFFVNISSMLKGMMQNGSNGSQSSMPGMGNSSGSSTNQAAASNASSGVPAWLAGLIGVIGLVVGGGATYVFTRQSAHRVAPAATPTSPTRTRV
ncbi:MAG: copper resistance protein CopC [Ktedonobacteraceae bacterium]|nr:copper resistance protein CopC [Ktedonobacteraceae bacterium]